MNRKLGILSPSQHIRVLETITEIHQFQTKGASREDLAYLCLGAVLRLGRSPLGWIGVLNKEGMLNTLAMSPMGWDACTWVSERDLSTLQGLELKGIWAEVYATGEPVLSNDPTQHPKWRGLPEGHPPLHSVLSYPLKRSGRLYGNITLANAPEGYSIRDLLILESLAHTITTVLDCNRVQEQMAKQKARLEGVLQHMTNGVAMYKAVDGGQDFVFLDLNAAGEEMDEVHIADLRGRRVTEIFPGVEGFGLLDVFRDVWKTGETQTHPEAFYYDDFREGWRNNQVFKLPSGEIVAVYTDITTEVGQRRNLEALNQQLMDANEELERFAYVASHDLREPLNKIVAFGERFQNTTKDCPHRISTNNTCGKAEKYLDIMIKATRRMDSLVMDLLAYSRAGKKEGHIVPVDVNAIVEDIWDSLAVVVEDKGATLECGELPPVWGDQVPIHQMFNNLIMNALKFMRPDRPPVIRITAKVHPEDYQVEFIVEDNGIGFDPQYAEQIFGVFSRLHSRFAYPGTGMGLALVRRIARRYGGDAEAVGVPDEGASFHVKLPAVEVEDA